MFCKRHRRRRGAGRLLRHAGGDITYLDWLLSAWGWTLSVALLRAGRSRWCVGSRDGHPAHHAERAAGALGNAWTELFRNIPLLVQMFLWYYVLPEFAASSAATGQQAVCPSFVPAVLCARLLHLGAHRRAGARRHPVACRAASATPAWRWGSTLPQTYRYVLLPMAFRIVIPPLTSEIDEHHQELVGGASPSASPS
ncbi:MAG: hypothetical protein MZW92_62590 [Comamonadaceae bacterium]|nr:hypothetical protein [Comamonadaceae bacterium]